MTARLPDGFAAAEAYVADWIAEDAAGRDRLRGAKNKAEREAFYRDMRPLIGAALDLLDAKPLDEFDQAETNLMQLALTYPHIAQAEEVQGPDEAKHAAARARLPITSAPADI